ncbi:MAG: sialidase family protein [Planctomycetota bacterium]
MKKSRALGGDKAQRNAPLAQDYTVFWRVPDPMQEIAYCPALARLPNGRLIGNILLSDRRDPTHKTNITKVFSSDDRGKTWVHRKDMAMVNGYPFAAGRSAYVIGGMYGLTISRSDDGGDTWSDPAVLAEGKWYSVSGSVEESNGRIYLVKECFAEETSSGYAPRIHAPVVMSARLGDDLTRADAWTYSNRFSFQDALREFGDPNLIGVPFYKPGSYGPGRTMGADGIGWSEANLVRIKAPEHIWHDPTGRTFHILMRADTGGTNLACLAKAVETEDGKIRVGLETAPSGAPMLYIPLPGGHGTMCIVYDEDTRLYWMAVAQSTDSMQRVELMPPKRYALPNNERRRLALHFSKNCMDWCFAGLVAAVEDMGQSHYGAHMVIDGADLLLLMRTSDPAAKNAHDSNLITFHKVENFRKLVY